MMSNVYLISCVSQKQNRPLPAKDIYTSNLFKKTRHYAEINGDKWYILSAEHGLLHPNQVIHPYNKTLNKMTVTERKKWADQVLKSLRKVINHNDLVVVLAGKRYREFILNDLNRLSAKVEVPMEGLRIGEQLRWLKERSNG